MVTQLSFFHPLFYVVAALTPLALAFFYIKCKIRLQNSKGGYIVRRCISQAQKPAYRSTASRRNRSRGSGLGLGCVGVRYV